MNLPQNRNRGDWLVLVAGMALPTAVTWLYFVALDGADKTLQQAAYAFGKAVQFALPVVWLGLVRRERLGIPRPTVAGLPTGGFLGVIVGGGMLALYFTLLKGANVFAIAAEAVRLKVASFGASTPSAFLAMGVFYSLIHSLLEEYYWRWFVYGQSRRWMTFAPAVIASSLAFAAHHVIVLAHYFGWGSPITWFFSLSVAVGGALWATLYAFSRSLYGPWLSHALVDAAIFLIGFDMVFGTA